MKSETVSLVRRVVVGTLVAVLALLEPVGLLAQRGGAIPVPRSPQVPPGIFQTAPDPVLDALTADMIQTAKSAYALGINADHLRHHAASLHAVAKHLRDHGGVDAQVVAWANAQNADAFQFQMPDPKAVEAALSFRRQNGLPTDDVFAALNATPQQKRAILLALRTKGISGNLDEDAAFLERIPAMRGVPHIVPALNNQNPSDQIDDGRMTNCQLVGWVGTGYGALGLFLSIFGGPVAAAIGIVTGIISLIFGGYNMAKCPGMIDTKFLLQREEVTRWIL